MFSTQSTPSAPLMLAVPYAIQRAPGIFDPLGRLRLRGHPRSLLPHRALLSALAGKVNCEVRGALRVPATGFIVIACAPNAQNGLL